MPGPSSSATTMRPWRVPSTIFVNRTSPRFAYIRMLRAISEIAAAITVWSPAENPTSAASSRPVCRARTTSTSAAMRQQSWSPTVDAPMPLPILDTTLALAVEEGEAFLEVERGRDALEGEAELHHGERDLGLDSDDHRFRAA